MKRFFVLLFGAVMVCTMSAQVLERDEAALVYYSPKTTVTLDFTYTVEVQEKGIYAEFALDMLGTDKAVKENASIYTLKNVLISTRTTPDYARPHKVPVEAGFPVLLRINEKGLLCAYNMPQVPHQHANQPADKPAAKSDKNPSKTPFRSQKIAPLPEEVLTAATPLAQANEVAKQIFHLRETRMYLLSGEVEHAPADGKSMELVLAELDKQERALTELFIGKTHKKTEHKFIRMAPNNDGQLLFFSDENGFTDGDNIDADTIRVQMVCHPQTLQPAADKKKKGSDPSPIVYNVPGTCDVKVLYQGRTLASRSVPVAQLGADVALPKSLFLGKELPQIVFSEKTGNIISISK